MSAAVGKLHIASNEQLLNDNNNDNDSTTTDNISVRKLVCRYGSGCTHMFDPVHRVRFWHPSLPALDDEQIKAQFICNECGFGTSSLPDLQMHLKRKTAWSNASLVGCRISCLVDYKEWHEGLVTQFHRGGGKHLVEFRFVNEKRWLAMRKIAFYIVERPSKAQSQNRSKDQTHALQEDASPSPAAVDSADAHGAGGEYKENEGDGRQRGKTEDSWVFCENITTDFAFAQSVLFKVYGNSLQETGHLTKGHVSLTDGDRMHAQHAKVSLLYGELLPRGANKAFGPKRLDATRAEVLYDLGMGCGKVVVQAFLQFRNLKYVYGVELSLGRYKIAEESVLKMVALLGADNYQIELCPGKYVIITEGARSAEDGDAGGQRPHSAGSSSRLSGDGAVCGERVLHLECGNMFGAQANMPMADIVMMETDVPPDLHADLHRLLGAMRSGARLLSYLDLRRIWGGTGTADGGVVAPGAGNGALPLGFRQLESNRHLSDRYPTSWSVHRGHHFYFWVKTPVDTPAPTTWGAMTRGLSGLLNGGNHAHDTHNGECGGEGSHRQQHEGPDGDPADHSSGSNSSDYYLARGSYLAAVRARQRQAAMEASSESANPFEVAPGPLRGNSVLLDLNVNANNSIIVCASDAQPISRTSYERRGHRSSGLDNDEDDDSIISGGDGCLPGGVFPSGLMSWLWRRVTGRASDQGQGAHSPSYYKKVVPLDPLAARAQIERDEYLRRQGGSGARVTASGIPASTASPPVGVAPSEGSIRRRDGRRGGSKKQSPRSKGSSGSGSGSGGKQDPDRRKLLTLTVEYPDEPQTPGEAEAPSEQPRPEPWEGDVAEVRSTSRRLSMQEYVAQIREQASAESVPDRLHGPGPAAAERHHSSDSDDGHAQQPYAMGQEYSYGEPLYLERGTGSGAGAGNTMLRTPPPGRSEEAESSCAASPALAISFLTAPSPLPGSAKNSSSSSSSPVRAATSTATESPGAGNSYKDQSPVPPCSRSLFLVDKPAEGAGVAVGTGDLSGRDLTASGISLVTTPVASSAADLLPLANHPPAQWIA